MMPSVPAQASPRGDRRITIAVCVFLTLIVWIVFGQTLGHDFINFDDDRYVYQNSHVSAGLTLEGFKWLLTHSHASLWHPLTTLTHMIDCQIYGLKPGGHHFTNILLHNVAVVLLFLVVRQMTSDKGQSNASAARTSDWRSAFVAAIFAIHPMRVESVAWIAERKDVLSGVLLMLTLGAYLRYVRAPGLSRYLVMSIFLACGLMSKATFVTVPLLLLFLDYWPLRRANDFAAWRRLAIEKIPLLFLSLVASVATLFAQTVTMASLDQLPLLLRLENAAVSVIVYLRQMFWPFGLAVFYPHPQDQLNIWIVAICAVLIAAITLLAIFVRRNHPYVFVGWFWYLLLLVPVSGIVQAGLQAHADRFTYLPHIGITILLTWTCVDFTRQWRNRRLILAVIGTFIVTASAALAYKQTTYWRNSISVWQHALAVTTESYTAEQNLAAALWSAGRIAESHERARQAAIMHARTVLRDHPYDVPIHNDLGVLLVQTDDVHGAIEEWETSLQINPDDGNALNNLAWTLATFPADSFRDGKRAVEFASKATTLPGGDSPIVLRTLAAAYAEAGDFPKAVQTAERAADLASAQKNTSLMATLQHEIELYRTSTPYRESPPK